MKTFTNEKEKSQMKILNEFPFNGQVSETDK